MAPIVPHPTNFIRNLRFLRWPHNASRITRHRDQSAGNESPKDVQTHRLLSTSGVGGEIEGLRGGQGELPRGRK